MAPKDRPPLPRRPAPPRPRPAPRQAAPAAAKDPWAVDAPPELDEEDEEWEEVIVRSTTSVPFRLGVAFLAFAIADAALFNLIKVDLTGVSWSYIVSGLIGIGLIAASRT